MLVSEQLLNNHALCPLMGPSVNHGCLERVAIKLLSLSMLASYHGGLIKIEGLRDRFLRLWKEDVPTDHPEYIYGLPNTRGVAKRAVDFLREFEILQPVLPYELNLHDCTIQGDFALVKKRTEKSYPMMLVMHGLKPKHALYPDLRSLARIVAVKMTHPEYKKLGIIHVPLLLGQPWKVTHVDERLARTWLGSILDSMKLGPYPVPGKHCQGCETHACLEVYRER